MYEQELKKLTLMGILGCVIGITLALATNLTTKIGELCLFGFLFAGIPYGWVLSGRLVGGWIVVGNIAIMFIAFALRIAIAVLTGWIAYPVYLIYILVKAHSENKVV